MLLTRVCKKKFLNQHFTLIFHQIHYSKKGTFIASPDTVFDVVKKTEKYSDFIPWCKKSAITKYISPKENYTSLTIAFQKVKQLSYLSHVLISGEHQQNHKNQHLKDKIYKIQSTCREQPLKSLVSIWEIEKDPIIEGSMQQSVVYYSIEYEFSSPILQLTSRFFLDYVGEAMWVIFKEQAERRQREINQLLLKSKEGKFDGGGHITFGMSNKNLLNNQSINSLKQSKQQQQHTITTTTVQTTTLTDPAANLTQYLDKNTQIHKIYCTNQQFKSKLDKWSLILQGTNDFEVKLEFKIKNYLIHKS